MQPRIQFLFGILLYAILVRVLPYTPVQYPFNFSPVTAICLFTGCLVANRGMAYLLPLGAILLSDLGIAIASGHVDWAFPVNAAGVFEVVRIPNWAARLGGLAIAVLVGSWLQKERPGLQVRAIGAALAFEVVFFLVTNFVVWAFPPEAQMYPWTATGLWTCYAAAVPFFGKSLASTLLFTLLLFSPLGIRSATGEEPPREPEGDLVPVRVKS